MRLNKTKKEQKKKKLGKVSVRVTKLIKPVGKFAIAPILQAQKLKSHGYSLLRTGCQRLPKAQVTLAATCRFIDELNACQCVLEMLSLPVIILY